jgi:hypothetical protein
VAPAEFFVLWGLFFCFLRGLRIFGDFSSAKVEAECRKRRSKIGIHARRSRDIAVLGIFRLRQAEMHLFAEKWMERGEAAKGARTRQDK